MRRLGEAIDTTFGRPRAVLAISAHTLGRGHLVLAGARHEAVYDFGGFPQALYRLRYDAPGDPELARRAATLLADAGLAAQAVDEGGLDHGIWTALRYVYPGADVPVVPVAMNPGETPALQFAFGHALAPLAEDGVLIVGTGSITHNLRRVAQARGGFHALPPDDLPEVPESTAFRRWMHERASARDWDALLDYRTRAPHAAEMHPTDEHLLPWFVAAGAGGRDAPPLRLHESVTFGCLGMDAYAFGYAAGRLAAAMRG